LQPVIQVEDVRELREAVMSVYVDDILSRWIVQLVRTTRDLEEVAVGASVRGSLALERAARAWALLDRRAYVVPEDIEHLFSPVLLHRIVFRPTFLAEARRVGWPAAVATIAEKCFAAAPRPQAEAEQPSPPERLPVVVDD
jgi:MoxR-like ATPase